jgi:DNA polymerase V
MFALVDCNNFYASCERVFNPSLNGKPVVVLSNNDGCVIARSDEAKLFGVPMGAPAFKFKHVFEQKNIHVFSSNYALYGDMSSRVMNLLSQFTPDMEVYSIDEAFLQFEGFDYFDLQTIGNKISKTVHKGTGIPVSIGFAPTKALSKVANKIAKKFKEQTKGTYIIDTEEKRIKALKWLPVEDVWGIGRRHAKRLKAIHITNAYQFTQLSDEWVRKKMSIIGLRLKKELEGKSVLGLELPSDKKSIGITRTFPKTLLNYDDVKERVATFAIACSEKLRRQKLHCNTIMVFVKTNSHRKDLPYYNRNIVINTRYPTNSSFDIVKYAQEALKIIFKEGYQYKRAGVMVMNLTSQDKKQLSLFSNENPKHLPVMEVMDRLNKFYGTNKVKLGSQSLEKQWVMNQRELSPRYSTNIEEVITINLS